MTEYHGQLIGGPDNGNLITSTVEKVPATGTNVIYPDGPDGEAVVSVSKGYYSWNGEYFTWTPESFLRDPKS